MDAAIPLLALVALGIWFWSTRRRPKRAIERRLQQICLGDRAAAERLVDAELARTPAITRDEAISRAVARYERDNR